MARELPERADIVVIGGGVVGASTFFHLADRRAGDVVLVERESAFGQGATGRCAGGVRYQFATEINVKLSIQSLAMIERFAEVIGQDPGYRPCGYLFVLTREEDVEVFRRNVQMQRRLGVQTEWLSGKEVRRRVPMMRFQDALAGTFHSRDGLADPHSVVMGYIRRARERGGQAFTDAAVTGIEVAGGTVRAVRTTRGTLSTRCVVNAAGPWLGKVAELVGLRVPLVPLRRQMIATTPLPDLPADLPFVIDFARSLYFHREGQGILTGMSNPDEQPGFDQSVDAEWERRAMMAAVERMPMLAEAGRLAGWAGLYEVTPDAHPIFGETPIGGFWLVGGFSGHGFMHGPIAGKLMAECILDGRPLTVDVSSLDLARFRAGRLVQEYSVI